MFSPDADMLAWPVLLFGSCVQAQTTQAAGSGAPGLRLATHAGVWSGFQEDRSSWGLRPVCELALTSRS